MFVFTLQLWSYSVHNMMCSMLLLSEHCNTLLVMFFSFFVQTPFINWSPHMLLCHWSLYPALFLCLCSLFRWYYGNINRVKAEKLLLASQNKDGSFLVRISESHSDEYTISGKHHGLSSICPSLYADLWPNPVPIRVTVVTFYLLLFICEVTVLLSNAVTSY